MTTRIAISLACSICGARNYRTTRTMRVGSVTLALRKFCQECKQHTVHREAK